MRIPPSCDGFSREGGVELASQARDFADDGRVRPIAGARRGRHGHD